VVIVRLQCNSTESDVILREQYNSEYNAVVILRGNTIVNTLLLLL